MKLKIGSFLGILFLFLILTFGIHLGILSFRDMSLFENKIILSYCLNYTLAAIVLFVIQSNLNKEKANTGFIFMAGSGLKFAVFFIFFYPAYHQDEVMQTAEFAAFFTPYAVCLILEVLYLSKVLNNQTYSEDKPSEKKK